jgi:parallel beta-helix repeat protein
MKHARLLLLMVAMGMMFLGPFSFPGWAQMEFYVCSQHGDDQPGNGTAADPWASISYALTQIQLTDEQTSAVIYVFEGDYYENVVMRDSINLQGSYVHEGDDHTTGTRSTDPDPQTGEPGLPSSRIYSTLDTLPVVVAANALLEGFVIAGGSNGILCANASPTIRQNLIVSNYITGIFCQEGTPSIENNTISSNQRHGIHIVGDTRAPSTIVGNEISGNASSGIYVDVDPMVSCSVGSEELDAEPNYIHGNMVSGILVARGGGSVEIVNNRIRANQTCGICVCEESTPNIRRNTIEANVMTGISISRGGKDTNIDGNDIRLNEGYGILVQCTASADIRNNDIRWNHRDGIRFQGLAGSGPGRSHVVEGNNILWNYGNGITCTDQSNPRISGANALNIIAGNGSHGIYCDATSNPIIEDSFILANSRNGIVAAYQSEPDIERCIIFSNLGYGIEAKGSSLASVINNTIADNITDGISCNEYSHPTIRNCIISGNSGYGIFEAGTACDPAELSNNCFYQNRQGDYRDENTFTYTGASAINGSVNNRGNVVGGNIGGDPLFVAWGSFSRTNPIFVDVTTATEFQTGTEEDPFDVILEALLQYSYHLAQGSPCIGVGQGGVDIGAYPEEVTYRPKGNSDVAINVRRGNYYESNLVLNHNVTINGNNAARVIGLPLSRSPWSKAELPEFLLTEGSYFTLFYPTTGSTIDGFLEIAEGRIGVFVDRGFAPTIRNCSFVENRDAIVCFRSAPLIQGSKFVDNLENGVKCQGASPRIVRNEFQVGENDEKNGHVGVLCEAGAAPEITSCALTGHYTAGIICREASSPIVMTSTIQANLADGIYIDDYSDPIIKNSLIADNLRDGIYILRGSAPLIVGSEITRNKIYGIQCSISASPTIAANVVSHNIWDGIYVFSNSHPRIINNMIYRNRGNAIYIESYSAPEIINNTLAFNFNNGVFLRDHSAPIIRNNLLYYHRLFGIREYGTDSDPADFSNNCLILSLSGQYLDEGINIYWTGDDINTYVNNNGGTVANNMHADDPRFVNADNDDFHIRQDSPCIDKGTANGAPATDFDGDTRPQGAGYDIGADEYTAGGRGLSVAIDESSWDFITVPGTFTRPTGVASENSIAIVSSDNTNTFGYWCGVGHPIPIVPDCLYRFRFQVSTTLTDPSQVPAIRLRLNTASGEESDFLQIVSGNTGSCSPTPQGAAYDLYAYPPQESSTASMGTDVYYISFDILNFDPSDAANAGVSLHGVEVSRIPLSDLSASQQVRVYDFDTDNEHWHFSGTVAPFTAPLSALSSGCLQLRSTSNTDTFGFWSSDPGEVTLDTTGRLCRGTFTVSSDQVDRSKGACMRLRLGSEEGEMTVVKTISSPPRTTEAPGPTARDYEVYFVPVEANLGAGLLSAFDMLNFDPTDNPQVTLRLDKVVIETLDIPTAP